MIRQHADVPNKELMVILNAEGYYPSPSSLRTTKCKLRKEERTMSNPNRLVSISEAAKILGITTKTLRGWNDSGKLVPVRTFGKHRRYNFADVEKMVQGGSRIVQASSQQTFTVPQGFDLITDYRDLTQYSLAFAARNIGFLLLIGSPGSGKSRQVKSDLAGKQCTWIDSHATNLGLYCSVFEANNAPVILDDVNHFLKNKTACSLIKALTQTEETRGVNWESPVKALEERNVPRQYDTSSPICLIGNLWDAKNDDYLAIQDRSLPVAFYPTAETIHNRVIELGWCKDKEILDFIGDNMTVIPIPSMREYYLAVCYKKAGMDWKQKLLSIWQAS